MRARSNERNQPELRLRAVAPARGEVPGGRQARHPAAVRPVLREEEVAVTIVRVDKGANHWYELDGVRVPSVTTILRHAIPKQDILTGWAGRESGNYVIDHWDE